MTVFPRLENDTKKKTFLTFLFFFAVSDRDPIDSHGAAFSPIGLNHELYKRKLKLFARIK